MKLYGGPEGSFPDVAANSRFLLFDPPPSIYEASAGAAIANTIRARGLQPSTEAWDFLAIALTAVAADFTVSRSTSPDGWTREIDIAVALHDPDRWQHANGLAPALNFLTTDRWSISVSGGGATPTRPGRSKQPKSEAVALLSGGLDSLIGAIDLVERGIRPMMVSHTVRGDKANQKLFARRIGGGLEHLQLNHTVRIGNNDQENSQRARSLLFIALAVVAASTLPRHREGDRVAIYLNENGFIALNPPLTSARLGALSTRTAHPLFLTAVQNALDQSGLRVDVINPYALQTKGEMLERCRDQSVLFALACESTSCGRYQRFNYNHCGRCLPCQIRRAAFMRWGETDSTFYVYDDLGRNDENHTAFDDVRAVALALDQIEQPDGVRRVIASALIGLPHPRLPMIQMLERGFAELRQLHNSYSVS